MATKKKQHSPDIRSLVIEHFFNDHSYAIRAKEVLIPRPTLQSIIKKYKQTGCILKQSQKRKTTQHLFITKDKQNLHRHRKTVACHCSCKYYSKSVCTVV